jgi:DNA-binding IclR family transcriptional regulator
MNHNAQADDAAKASGGSQSAISKAFRLLDLVVGSPHALTLIDIAEKSGMPKPSAHRMLMQLEEAGLVKRDMSGKRFVHGDFLRSLSMRTLEACAQGPIVREIMTALVREVGESCNLGILDGNEVVYLERIECERPLRMHLRAGSRVPAHCTALGKLLLAMLPEARAERLVAGMELKRFTENTVTDAKTLLGNLAAIRASGISVNQEEHQPGLTGAAVAITMAGSHAGLAVHAPLFRMSPQEASDIATGPLSKAAAAIAAEWRISEANG